MSGFGFVVDDEGADKKRAGGAAAFALELADGVPDPAHLERCPTCRALDEVYGCVGLVPAPLSAAAERWLVELLPDDIEGLRGYLLRKAIAEYGHSGDEGEALRKAGLLAAPGPFTRHFGPFFRRFTVSSSQLVEELWCVGDVSPAHGLAVLVHLGGILVDGRVPAAMEDGPLLAELMKEPKERETRTHCAVEEVAEDDDPSLAGLKRYLRALWAAFVVDAEVRVFAPEVTT